MTHLAELVASMVFNWKCTALARFVEVGIDQVRVGLTFKIRNL